VRVARSRTLAAPVDAVWRVLEDPYAFPRWWPMVRRVEGVHGDGWTMVLGKEGGRGVRADQRLEASEPPALRRWALQVPGSPFERLLRASVVEARLAPAGDGAALTLELRRDMERDRFFTPEEAVDYGLIDRVHVDRNGNGYTNGHAA